MPKRSTQHGFTLIELLVALTLLALIVSSAAPLVQPVSYTTLTLPTNREV